MTRIVIVGAGVSIAAERVTCDARHILDERAALIDDAIAMTGSYCKYLGEDPAEEPRVDPRRSRKTARGGRSDDWKGRQFGKA